MKEMIILLKNIEKNLNEEKIISLSKSQDIIKILDSYFCDVKYIDEKIFDDMSCNAAIKKIIKLYLDSNNITIIKNKKEVNYDNLYSYKISKMPLLTQEQVIKLMDRIKNGDEEAKNKLIESNLRLVSFIAMRYVNKYAQLDDLIQEGSIGLIKAIDRYDYNKASFSTYAKYWIEQEIQHYLGYNSRPIRIPIDKLKIIIKMDKIKQNYYKQNNTIITDEEMSKLMSIPIDKIKELNKYNYGDLLSFSYGYGENGEFELIDVLMDEDESIEEKVIEHEKYDVLNDCLNTLLTDREKYVIECRFGFINEEMTLAEIAKKLNITREGVRKIENRAINKLKSKKKYLK